MCRCKSSERNSRKNLGVFASPPFPFPPPPICIAVPSPLLPLPHSPFSPSANMREFIPPRPRANKASPPADDPRLRSRLRGRRESESPPPLSIYTARHLRNLEIYSRISPFPCSSRKPRAAKKKQPSLLLPSCSPPQSVVGFPLALAEKGPLGCCPFNMEAAPAKKNGRKLYKTQWLAKDCVRKYGTLESNFGV